MGGLVDRGRRFSGAGALFCASAGPAKKLSTYCAMRGHKLSGKGRGKEKKTARKGKQRKGSERKARKETRTKTRKEGKRKQGRRRKEEEQEEARRKKKKKKKETSLMMQRASRAESKLNDAKRIGSAHCAGRKLSDANSIANASALDSSNLTFHAVPRIVQRLPQ